MNKKIITFLLIIIVKLSVAQNVFITNLIEIDLTRDSLQIFKTKEDNTKKKLNELAQYLTTQKQMACDFIDIEKLIKKIGYGYSFPFTNEKCIIPVLIIEAHNKKNHFNYNLIEFDNNFNETNNFTVKDTSIINLGNSNAVWLNLYQRKKVVQNEDKGLLGFIGMELFYRNTENLQIQKNINIDCKESIKSFHKIKTVLKLIKEEFDFGASKSNCIENYFECKYRHNNRGQPGDKIKYENEEEAGGRIENIFEKEFKLEPLLLKVINTKDKLLKCYERNGARCDEGKKQMLKNELYTTANKIQTVYDMYDDNSNEYWLEIFGNSREKMIEKYLLSLNAIILNDSAKYSTTLPKLYSNFHKKNLNAINVSDYSMEKNRVYNNYNKNIDSTFDMSFIIPFSKIKNNNRLENTTFFEVVKGFIEKKTNLPRTSIGVNFKSTLLEFPNGDIRIKITNDTSAKLLGNYKFKPGQYKSGIEKEMAFYITDLEEYLNQNIPNYYSMHYKELIVSASADGAPFSNGNFNVPKSEYEEVKDFSFSLTSDKNNKSIPYSFGELYDAPLTTKDEAVNYRNNSLLAFMRAYRVFDIITKANSNITSKKIECNYYKQRDPSKRLVDITYTIKKK